MNNFDLKLFHKPPFLFVDKILEIDLEKKHIKTLKNISINESFFQGHFPKKPIYPGVLIIEGLAQSANILLNYYANNKNLFALAKIKHAKFIKYVLPGDNLIFKVKILKQLNLNYIFFKGQAFVKNEEVAFSEFTTIKIKKKNEK